MRFTYRIAITALIILFLALYAFTSYSTAEIAPPQTEDPTVTQETPPHETEPELTPSPEPSTEPSPAYIPDPEEVTMLAKLVYGEARGIKSQTEQAAVAWCVLNRVDSTGYGMGRSVEYVVTFPDQFHGYNPRHPTVDDYGRDLRELAADVLTRWDEEKEGETDVGRVLPKEYLWFEGVGGHNVFRDAYRGGDKWDWRLPSPYES